jgi:hypothetical protein
MTSSVAWGGRGIGSKPNNYAGCHSIRLDTFLEALRFILARDYGLN